MPRFTGSRAITLLLALTGCPGKEGDDSQPSTSDTEPTSETTVDPTGGPDTTTDTGEPAFLDLFACEVPEACEKVSLHIDPEPVLTEACACGMKPCADCQWDPFFSSLANCKPVEEFTCATVLGLLAGNG